MYLLRTIQRKDGWMFAHKHRVHINDKKGHFLLSGLIGRTLPAADYKEFQQIIVLCIGTDRSTGDSLGPLTGTFLEKKQPPAHIIGNIDRPVHARNLDHIIKKINKEYTSPFIIAVDAGLGKKSSVGYIDVKKGPLKPGTGVNKKLTAIGNMHITGLVNVGGYMEYMVLQSTRLSIVIKMAELIAKGLNKSLINIKQEKKAYD